MKATRKIRGPEKTLAKTAAHKWEFKARFRRHAFGWKSQPAIQRVKEAVAEIKKVARKDAVLAACDRAGIAVLGVAAEEPPCL